MTVAAYADLMRGPDDPYVEHLRNAAARDLEAELWVATPDDSDEILGTVTICREGSPWQGLAGHDEGEFRMLAVPRPQRDGRGRRWSGSSSTGSGSRVPPRSCSPACRR